MTDTPQVTQADREYNSGWTSNPTAIAIAKLIADQCSDNHKNGSPKAPQRYAIIYQAAGMGAHQAADALRSQTAGEDECRLLLFKAHQRIEEIQRVCMDYLPPDSRISPNDALSDVIGLTVTKDYLDERFQIQTYLGILPTPPAQGEDHD